MTADPGRIFALTAAQQRFWDSTARYQDFEGAVRSGKTTIALLKLLDRHQRFPGLHSLAARWQEQDAKAQIKARLKELWPQGYLGHWSADESCYDLTDGGKCYIRGLKPGEDAAMYSKFAGLTLGIILVDQPEELPDHYFTALQARLSQPGVPNELYLLPNPPSEDHWIAHRFPEDNRDPRYAYLRTTVYDNAAHLPPDYIPELEAAYPEGHVLRRRFIEGRRGLAVVGDPVFASCFSRRLHAVDVALNPALPLLEGWDFGHKHPAVLWAQFPLDGGFAVLGECQGAGIFLEEFCPQVLALRQALFPGALEVQSCCDPAGAMHSSQGTAQAAVDVLHAYGVYPTYRVDANTPALRDAAIQKFSRALMYAPKGRPAVRIHPRCRVFLDGLEAGYVWDDRVVANTKYPNTRRPKKGGADDQYSHLQDCAQYLWITFGPMSPRTAEARQRAAEKAYWRQLRAAQADPDPAARPRIYHTRRGIL